MATIILPVILYRRETLSSRNNILVDLASTYGHLRIMFGLYRHRVKEEWKTAYLYVVGS